jgi:hypothetical protein
MPITTTNVVIGEAYGYTAAGDTAEPSAAPANGGAIAGWTQWGATEEGVGLNLERDITNHYIEESAIQVFSTPGTSTFSVTTQLAESTLANWKLAAGGGVIAGGTLTLSDTLDTYGVYLDMQAPGATTRRTVFIPRAQSVGSLDVANRRAEAKQLLGVQLNSSCTFAEIKISDKTGGS